MNRITGWICLALLTAHFAVGQSQVTVTVHAGLKSLPIPDDFMGLSFGMKALNPDKKGNYLFSPTNTALVELFHEIGLRHLRVGGTTVESPPETLIPDENDIDSLFAFARAAGVNKIIYSLRLLETDPAVHYLATNAAIAKYIWDHYQSQLEAFSLGNEPDRKSIFDKDLSISNFSSYMAKWRQFAAAITNAVPAAKFVGPDGGSGQVSWTTRFAHAQTDSHLVESVSEHYYAGGKGKDVKPHDAIESMLSPALISAYEKLNQRMAIPVMTNGISYRFTEANDHYSGGVPDASDTFAGALWALDFLHWWAAHGAKGVDFHNTQWVVSDVVHPDAQGRMTVNPKAYGLKAFDLGGHGAPVPVEIDNPAEINLSVYAVSESNALFVTIINKEHGPNGRVAAVKLLSTLSVKSARMVELVAPGGNVEAKIGVTVAGTTFDDGLSKPANWKSFKQDSSGNWTVEVQKASAVIIEIGD